MLIFRRLPVALVSGLLAVALLAGPAGANHSWAGYHWARTANPFTLRLGDNVDVTWDSYLGTASYDWTQSAVLDTAIVGGQGGRPKRCSATSGRVEVCNAAYGNTGYLGYAQVWVSSSHITKGTVKVNDTYFNTTKYNTPEWRNLVMCQEVGHTLGLDHQDEIFDNANLGTCMDYTNLPDTNQHPNQHDYDQLALIYAHLDGSTTVGSTGATTSPADGGSGQAEWGRAIRYSGDGRPSKFERDLGGGKRLFTFVVWAK